MAKVKPNHRECKAKVQIDLKAAVLAALLWISLFSVANAESILTVTIGPNEPRGPLGILTGIHDSYGYPGADTGYKYHPYDDWTFWAESGWTQKSRAFIEKDPVPNVVIRMGNTGNWSLNHKNTFEVSQGQTWTLTAVIGGRKWGWLGENSASVGIIGLDSNGNVVNWVLGSKTETGNFGWKKVHVTVTVPSGIAKLQPRFFGHGGGEFFVCAADFSQSDSPANLTVPNGGLPPEVSHLRLINPDKPLGIYEPNTTVKWRVGVWGTSSSVFPYKIVNGYDETVASGEVSVGQLVSFTPTKPGYYELRVGTDFSNDISVRYCSGIDGIAVLPKAQNWSPGCNPFGTNTSTWFPGQHRYSSQLPHLGISWERGCYGNILGEGYVLPSNLQAFADAWEARVRAGLHPHSINTIEVWNEPNNELRGDWTIEAFLNMVKAAREGAHRADPTVKIAVNFEHVRNMPPNVKTFETFYQAGGKGHFDIMTLHPYMQGTWARPPIPESPEDGNMIWWAQEARSLVNQFQDNHVEIWSSEFGWPIVPGSPKPCPEIDQARFIVRGAVLQLACGLKRVCQFMIEDVPGWDPCNGTFGMVRGIGGVRPSLVAYSVLAQTVGDLPYAGWLDFGPSRGVFLFGNASKTVAVLWHPSKTRTLNLQIPTTNAQLVGFFGEKTNIPNANQEIYKCRIGPSPIYLVMEASPQAVANSFGGPLRTEMPSALFKTMDAEVSSGIDTTGLLVNIIGKVTKRDSANRYFYLDDGSGVNDGTNSKGVRVSLTSFSPINYIPNVGNMVSVTGVASWVKDENRILRCILPRSNEDIIPVVP